MDTNIREGDRGGGEKQSQRDPCCCSYSSPLTWMKMLLFLSLFSAVSIVANMFWWLPSLWPLQWQAWEFNKRLHNCRMFEWKINLLWEGQLEYLCDSRRIKLTEWNIYFYPGTRKPFYNSFVFNSSQQCVKSIRSVDCILCLCVCNLNAKFGFFNKNYGFDYKVKSQGFGQNGVSIKTCV